MPTAVQTSEPAQTRDQILDAAQARLLHFGYHKTTMAEIADDVGMSAANLYRYFPSKRDIVAECAARCMDERLERLRAIAEQPRLDSATKLERYVLELVDDCHALAGPDSRVGELVDTITRERRDLIHTRNAVHYDLLKKILDQGCGAGELEVEDTAAAARLLHSALVLFDVPLFVGLYERREFEERARGLVRLMLDGLRAPGASAGAQR